MREGSGRAVIKLSGVKVYQWENGGVFRTAWSVLEPHYPEMTENRVGYAASKSDVSLSRWHRGRTHNPTYYRHFRRDIESLDKFLIE